MQKNLKIPSKTVLLLEFKNTSGKNIAKNMHFVQKKCKREK